MSPQTELFAQTATEPNAQTQCADVLEYLRAHGSITPLDALREFGCMRLAARVYDLRRAGHAIHETTCTSTNWREKPIRYSRYRLGGGASE